MKILYHHRTLGDGAEGVHIAEIVRSLREDGHEVDVFSPIGEQTNAPSARRSFLFELRRRMPRALFELAEVGYGLAAGARLSARMRRSGPAFLYERYALANTAGVIASRAAGVPLVLEVNAPLAYEREHWEKSGISFPRMQQAIENAIFRMANRCVVVSSPLKTHLERIGVNPARIEVMPNGADPDRYDPQSDGAAVRLKHGLGSRLVVGFVGVVRPWHGLELLATAFAKAAPQDAVLLVVGDGPACDELMETGRTLGIADRIKITGRVPHAEIANHVAAMDVAVSPRATFYASPMKIPEYMAGGRCVIGPRMGNIEDLIEDGATGLLFEPESVDSLAHALKLATEDASLRNRLATAGRREVERRLNWRRNARRIVELADEVARERGQKLLPDKVTPRIVEAA